MVAVKAGDNQANLVYSAISHRVITRERKFHFGIYANMVEATVIKPLTTPLETTSNGNKNAITTFSNRSRRRMMKMVNKKRSRGRGIFVTLTYADEICFNPAFTLRDFSRHLDNFMKRCERQWSNVTILWRKEFETRKSGDNIGQVAPHAHMILEHVTGDLSDIRDDIEQWWHEISTDGDTEGLRRSRVDVKPVQNDKHAMFYVSKYVGKADIQHNLTIQLYLNGHAGDVGRHWGIRGDWNTEPSVIVALTLRQWRQLRRELRKYAKKRNRHYAKLLARMPETVGASLFGLGDSDISTRFLWETDVMRLIEWTCRNY